MDFERQRIAQWNAEDQRDRLLIRAIVGLLTLTALAALVLLAAPAWAQGAAPSPAQPSGWSVLLLKLLGADWVWNLLGLLGSLVAGKLLLFLHAKEGESKVAKVGAIVAEAAQAAVLQVEQELRPKVQLALADGVLSPEEGATLKAAAMAILKTKLPAGVLSTAGAIFGPLLDGWLSKQLEVANAQMPAVLAAPVPPKP